MTSSISKFGQKFSEDSGILQLMDDLGKAMAEPGDKAMFGGGNPAIVPEVRQAYMDQLQKIANDPDLFNTALGNYDTPKGNTKFIDSLVNFFNKNYDWNISSDNIAITPGSQSGFFSLLNMLGGEQSDGSLKKILFPLVPEYIGYADQGLHDEMFVASRPQIEEIGAHEFKYRVDVENLVIDESIAAMCISRPTNPTGNVVDDDELEQLRSLARKHSIPLIVDNAYGLPFPGVIVAEKPPKWDEDLIFSMSLSKVGLPAARIGIFIARADIAKRLTSITAVLNLANPNIGQVLVQPMLDDGSLIELCEKYIQPYYQQKADYMRANITRHFEDSLPYRLHKHEGSYFFWLWLPDLPISSQDLYERLKNRDVIVVPGEHFFPGLDEDWDHKTQCLRINFSRPKEEVDWGLPILAEEIAKVYP